MTLKPNTFARSATAVPTRPETEQWVSYALLNHLTDIFLNAVFSPEVSNLVVWFGDLAWKN